MPELDDNLLARRAVEGDTDAFGVLANRYRDAIYSFALRMLGDSEEAFDAAQEILIRAYTGLETFDRRRQFRPWLFAIAANTCKDLLRRRRRHDRVRHDENVVDEPADDGASPAGVVAVVDLQRELTAALQHLSDAERTVVVLKHTQGFTYEEISSVMGMSVGTLKSHAHRGRRKLTELLAPAATESAQ